MMTEMALTVQGLCKAYPRFHLKDVTLHVPRGTVVGLIGENGAGKSTLIGAALGLVKRDAGAVSVLGKETLDAETLGQVGGRDAGHGLVRDGSRVEQRPGGRPKDRIVEQGGVLRRAGEVGGQGGAVECHEHVAHVKHDGAQLAVHGAPFVA